MNIILIVALSELAAALLIAILSIPLIFRRVPMNALYGARFAASFKSNQNWYDINEYAGKSLLLASIPIFIYGIIGVLFHQRLPEWYIWAGTFVVLSSVLVATWTAYRKSLEIDRRNGEANPRAD